MKCSSKHQIVFSILIGVWMFICACEVRAKVEIKSDPIPLERDSNPVVVDNLGYKYRLHRPQRTLSEMLTEIELWERIDPPDKKRWYARTLGSKRDTNRPPIFVSVEK
jgi:hypothetical protein